MAHRTTITGFAGLIAASSFAATPANAAQVSINAPQAGASTLVETPFESALPTTLDTDRVKVEGYRHRYGWGRYGRYRGHRHRSTTGDIVAGILVLGGIAAIASAASNNNRRREREVVYVDRDQPRDDTRRTNRRSSSGSGIDNAVTMCLNEIERDVRVENVDGASRISQGWVVSGTLFNGSGFTCQIDNNGRISSVNYAGFSSAESSGNRAQVSDVEDNQYSDDRYANARAELSAEDYAQARDVDEYRPDLAARDVANEPRPAYPGGPLPGESFED